MGRFAMIEAGSKVCLHSLSGCSAMRDREMGG